MTTTLREIKIEVTYACPLICVHCSSEAYPGSTTEMQSVDVHRILHEAASMGVEEVAFSGGEPLLWKGLDTAVEAATRLQMRSVLYTSGNVPDVKMRLDMLAGLGLGRAVFSVFGASADSHEQVTRRRGSFDKTIEAISVSAEIGLAAGFHFVAMARNYAELAGVCAIANRVGAHDVSVLRFVPQGRGRLLLGGSLDSLQSLELKRCIEHLRSEGHVIRTGSPLNYLGLNNPPECLSAVDRLIVAADGRVYPCDAFKQVSAESIVGTADFSVLGPACSLADAWERSPYLIAVREAVCRSREHPCADCTSLEVCGSGCLAQKAVIDGRLHAGPDPGCIRGNALGGARA